MERLKITEGKVDTLQCKVLEKAGDQSRLPGRGKTKYQDGQLSL